VIDGLDVLLVDGTLTPATGGATFETVDPTTEEVLGAAADAGPADLAAAVHSGEPERAWAVDRQVRTGTMSVNGGVWYAGDVPFGGYKQSGLGREMGVPGFEAHLETKAVAEGVPRS